MHTFHFFLFAFILLLYSSCSNPKDQPEYIVEQYASFINQGKIEEAKRYCTDARKAYLSALVGVMESAESRPDSSLVQIEKITCYQDGQVILCEVIERDSFDVFHINYQLTQENGQWLIDQPSIKGKIETHQEILDSNTED